MLDRAITAGAFSLCLLTLAPSALAQSPGTPPPSDTQISTLQMSTRVVLLDVAVTDTRGTPIRGLTRSDFHILDNKLPQTLSTFEEHTAAASTQPTPR